VVVLTGRGKFYTAGKELVESDTSEAGKDTIAKRRQVTK
jgi:peroxisomal 3,2-trans-enoyl-CoA isomerase